MVQRLFIVVLKYHDFYWQLVDPVAEDTCNAVMWEGQLLFLIGAMWEIIGGFLFFQTSRALKLKSEKHTLPQNTNWRYIT